MSGSTARRAVFLDRDGVLNRAIVRDGKPYPPDSAADLEILPDVPGALAELKEAGFLLLVVTNQPDVGAGLQSRDEVDAIHRRLRTELPIDDFFTCYHQDRDACECRKPSPGLLRRAAVQHGLCLALCYMVGDRWRDVDAGHRAGCQTVLLDYGYRERSPEHEPSIRVNSLQEAAQWILQHHDETAET
jgi:D-glycero-D-manno-heptose 1,7-bisphosphate phosphatase